MAQKTKLTKEGKERLEAEYRELIEQCSGFRELVKGDYRETSKI